MNIDLSGLTFSSSGRQICAVCGKDFDNDGGRGFDADDDGDNVPLLLWKDGGKLMLTLCWDCAQPRMTPSSPDPTVIVAELDLRDRPSLPPPTPPPGVRQ